MSYVQSCITIASNGRVVIPANMRAGLGCPNGGDVVARLVDGTVVLEPVDAAIRRAQAMVREFVPADAGLADELIKDRRAAAACE